MTQQKPDPKPKSAPKHRSEKPAGLKAFALALAEAFGDRTRKILDVVDEALASDDLKDRKWAVDLILKRTPDTSASDSAPTATPRPPSIHERLRELESLSDDALLQRLRTALEPWPLDADPPPEQ